MASVELNDRRLNERLATLLGALGEHPTASIPAACGGFNETTAAYRFFDNEKVTFDSALAPHFAQTRQRIAEPSTVLLVQDTTELEFTRPVRQMVGGTIGRLRECSGPPRSSRSANHLARTATPPRPRPPLEHLRPRQPSTRQ